MTKVNLSNGNETKPDTFPGDISKSASISFFLSKYIKVFQWLSKSEFLSFMTKVKPNNGNETKSDIFHGTYLNLAPYLSVSKNIKIFQWFSKSKFLSFMTIVNPSNGIETKSVIFPWDILI